MCSTSDDRESERASATAKCSMSEGVSVRCPWASLQCQVLEDVVAVSGASCLVPIGFVAESGARGRSYSIRCQVPIGFVAVSGARGRGCKVSDGSLSYTSVPMITERPKTVIREREQCSHSVSASPAMRQIAPSLRPQCNHSIDSST